MIDWIPQSGPANAKYDPMLRFSYSTLILTHSQMNDIFRRSHPFSATNMSAVVEVLDWKRQAVLLVWVVLGQMFCRCVWVLHIQDLQEDGGPDIPEKRGETSWKIHFCYPP